MKHLMITAALLIVMVSCKKQDNPSPAKVNSPSSTNTYGMNSVELGLVGNWVMDKRTDVTVGYDSFGNPDTNRTYTYFNNPAMNTLSLICQVDTNRSGSYIVGGYKCTTSMGMSFGASSPWRASGDSLRFYLPFSPPSNFALYRITSVSQTELELRYGTPTQYGLYHFQR